MNFFVLTVTDESDMLADSCAAVKEGFRNKWPRCTKRVVDTGLWGSVAKTTFGFTPPKPRRRAYVLNEVVCDGHSCWGSLRTGVYFGQTCLLSL